MVKSHKHVRTLKVTTPIMNNPALTGSKPPIEVDQVETGSNPD